MDKSHITWKIRGVIQVYDSFTARPANLSQLRVFTEEGIAVVKKDNGILVFVENARAGKNLKAGENLSSGENAKISETCEMTENREKRERNYICVRLESPIFLSEEVLLPASARALPLCLRLRPGKAYPAPNRAGILFGHCMPGADVFFVFEPSKTGESLKIGAEDGNEKRLLRDVVPGTETIEIYHPGRVSLEGEWLELEYNSFRERLFLERMNVTEDERPDTGQYKICGQAIKGTYPRLQTTLRPVHATKSDNQGEYIFFFRQVPDGMAHGRICVQPCCLEKSLEREQNIKTQTKPQTKQEIKSEIKQQARQEVKSETKQEMKLKTEQEVTICQGKSIRLDL